MILQKLYEHRAMTTEQLSEYFGMSKSYGHRKMYIMRNSGLILSHPIIDDKGRKRGAYHRISEQGITLLKETSYPVTKTASDLRVDDLYLPYLLLVNDLMIDLSPYGWTMLDSRITKSRYNLNRGDGIQGLLISPDGKEYGIYVFMTSTTDKSLVRIVHEFNKNKIEDILLFAKGESSLKSVVNYCTSISVVKGGSLKALPYGFGRYYLRALDNEMKLINFIEGLGLRVTPSRNSFKNQRIFDYVTVHEQEEKYIVNLMDTDLMKIHDIKRYSKDDYEQDGRRLLILTQMREFHEELIGDVHHIDYLEISYDEVMLYCE